MKKMKVEDLLERIKGRMEESEGVAIHVRKRAKFEGWLKVELCSILSKDHKVEPEHYMGNEVKDNKTRIDLLIDDSWAMELKTANTNYVYPHVPKSKPITKNLEGIYEDMDKLTKLPQKYKTKSVVFVVFPCSLEDEKKLHELDGWEKIKNNIKTPEYPKSEYLKFKSGAEGIIYYLEV